MVRFRNNFCFLPPHVLRPTSAPLSIVWISQGDVGQERFSYENIQLPAIIAAPGRWYPALLVVSSDWLKVIFECPKIALQGSRVWVAHYSRVRVWNVYGATEKERATASCLRLDVDVSLQDHGMDHDFDDDDADIITLRGASQPPDTKKRKRSQDEDHNEIAEKANAVVSDGDESDDQDVMTDADRVHETMRQCWEVMHDTDFDPGVLDSLSNLLFMKRKSKEPNSQERAFASQEETVHAILSVLKIRKSFLRSKNIVDHRHVLTEDERGELTKRQREAYDSTSEQLALQARDQQK